LKIAVEADASDLHITTHIPPRIRVHGDLRSVDQPPLNPADAKHLIYSMLTDKQKKHFEEKLELDFSFGIKELGRFRANIFMQKGAVAAAIRRFLPSMWSFKKLGIPQRVAQLYFEKMITLKTAMSVTSYPEELTDIIQRKEAFRPSSFAIGPKTPAKK
jgi:twitching motility protein PilT